MGLFSFFKQEEKKNTASLAKERLQILIAHEHSDKSSTGPDYLPKLRDELLQVIRKYVNVDDDSVNVKVEKGDNYDMLELNVTLPDAR
ncbi:MAG TPA: cell division topological specificity factor MinE [Leucothrix mucor]|nr:cell division topological specificity factor MinE [Leucothrix mucor]